MLPRVVV